LSSPEAHSNPSTGAKASAAIAAPVDLRHRSAWQNWMGVISPENWNDTAPQKHDPRIIDVPPLNMSSRALSESQVTTRDPAKDYALAFGEDTIISWTPDRFGLRPIRGDKLI
jgi:hypothetical protein